MQTLVNNEPARAYEGMVGDKTEREVSAIAAEMVYFGKAVSRSLTVGLNAFPKVVRGFTSGESFEGIAAASQTVERLADPTTGAWNQAPYGAYPAQTMIDRLVRKGRVWVKSADAVDDLSKSVFVKNADTAGTPATITDTTVYPVADQDGLTSVVTIAGFGAQTVTFSGTTTTAAQVVAQMNAQLLGCAVEEVGGQVKISTDLVGSTQTIAVAAGTGALTWAAPVAGTGDIAIHSDNAKGSFRATAAAGYTEITAAMGARWVGADVINGSYYGYVEVNLP